MARKVLGKAIIIGGSNHAIRIRGEQYCQDLIEDLCDIILHSPDTLLFFVINNSKLLFVLELEEDELDDEETEYGSTFARDFVEVHPIILPKPVQSKPTTSVSG